MTTEKQLINKLEELVKFHKGLIYRTDSDLSRITTQDEITLGRFESEISALKQEVEKESEQPKLSAEEVLDKYIEQAKKQGWKVEIAGKIWILKAMNEFAELKNK